MVAHIPITVLLVERRHIGHQATVVAVGVHYKFSGVSDVQAHVMAP
jgi:hypothetical protein